MFMYEGQVTVQGDHRLFIKYPCSFQYEDEAWMIPHGIEIYHTGVVVVGIHTEGFFVQNCTRQVIHTGYRIRAQVDYFKIDQVVQERIRLRKKILSMLLCRQGKIEKANDRWGQEMEDVLFESD